MKMPSNSPNLGSSFLIFLFSVAVAIGSAVSWQSTRTTVVAFRVPTACHNVSASEVFQVTTSARMSQAVASLFPWQAPPLRASTRTEAKRLSADFISENEALIGFALTSLEANGEISLFKRSAELEVDGFVLDTNLGVYKKPFPKTKSATDDFEFSILVFRTGKDFSGNSYNYFVNLNYNPKKTDFVSFLGPRFFTSVDREFIKNKTEEEDRDLESLEKKLGVELNSSSLHAIDCINQRLFDFAHKQSEKPGKFEEELDKVIIASIAEIQYYFPGVEIENMEKYWQLFQVHYPLADKKVTGEPVEYIIAHETPSAELLHDNKPETFDQVRYRPRLYEGMRDFYCLISQYYKKRLEDVSAELLGLDRIFTSRTLIDASKSSIGYKIKNVLLAAYNREYYIPAQKVIPIQKLLLFAEQEVYDYIVSIRIIPSLGVK